MKALTGARLHTLCTGSGYKAAQSGKREELSEEDLDLFENFKSL
jgi:hypothetical protein